MSSCANLFVYSNAATLVSSGLSNTGLENVFYCSTSTDAGPIRILQQRLYLVVLSSINVLSNHLITLFISKLSIEKHQLIIKCGFREQGVCREKHSVIYYLDHTTICLASLLNKITFHIKYVKALHVCVIVTSLHGF